MIKTDEADDASFSRFSEIDIDNYESNNRNSYLPIKPLETLFLKDTENNPEVEHTIEDHY